MNAPSGTAICVGSNGFGRETPASCVIFSVSISRISGGKSGFSRTDCMTSIGIAGGADGWKLSMKIFTTPITTSGAASDRPRKRWSCRSWRSTRAATDNRRLVVVDMVPLLHQPQHDCFQRIFLDFDAVDRLIEVILPEQLWQLLRRVVDCRRLDLPRACDPDPRFAHSQEIFGSIADQDLPVAHDGDSIAMHDLVHLVGAH